MTSGNYCLVNETIAGVNEKCRRLDQDKTRLSNQLNQLLQAHKELQTKYDELNQQNLEVVKVNSIDEMSMQIAVLENSNSQLQKDNELLRQ